MSGVHVISYSAEILASSSGNLGIDREANKFYSFTLYASNLLSKSAFELSKLSTLELSLYYISSNDLFRSRTRSQLLASFRRTRGTVIRSFMQQSVIFVYVRFCLCDSIFG
jgi:hypothetical protein